MMTAMQHRLLTELGEMLDDRDRAALLATGHFVAGDTTVGLVFPEDPGSDAAHVYLDLGPIPEHRRAQVHEGMLRTNLRPDDDSSGHFGVHPVTGHATFHMRLHGLDRIHGADLGRFIAGEVGALDGWMDRVAVRSIRRAA